MHFLTLLKNSLNLLLIFVIGILVLVSFVPLTSSAAPVVPPPVSATSTTPTTTNPVTPPSTPTSAGSTQTPIGFTDCIVPKTTAPSDASNLFGRCLKQIRTFLVILGLFLVAIRIAVAALEDFNPFVNGNSLTDSIQLFRDIVIGLILILIPSVFLSFFNEAALDLNFINLGGLLSNNSAPANPGSTVNPVNNSNSGVTGVDPNAVNSNIINLNGTPIDLNKSTSVQSLLDNPVQLRQITDLFSKCTSTNVPSTLVAQCNVFSGFINQKPQELSASQFSSIISAFESSINQGSGGTNGINEPGNYLLVDYERTSIIQVSSNLATYYVELIAKPANQSILYVNNSNARFELKGIQENDCRGSNLLKDYETVKTVISRGVIVTPPNCQITRVAFD